MKKQNCRKKAESRIFGGKDSYERKPSGLSFVYNQSFLELLTPPKKLVQRVKNTFLTRWKRFLCLLCAGSTVLSLAGCAQTTDLPDPEDTTPLPVQSAEETEESGPRLPEVLSLPYDSAHTLDPVTCPDGIQQTVGSLLYEGLFRLDDALEAQYSLCQSYTYDAERYRYTFTLRSGVTFSDGTALSAADAKATLERARASVRYAARLDGVVSITARDLTLTVTLSGPNIAFPALLDIPIVKKGTDTQAAPIGTGPYFFSQEESGACLIANQSWWRRESRPVERISLSETNQDAMFYRFNSHDVHLITADLTGSAAVSVTGNVGCYDAPTTVMQYVGINTTRLTDAALRQALWQGFDRASVISAYLSGHGTAAQFPIAPASALYPGDLETAYSMDGFRAALAACKSLPERTLSLLVNEENSFKVSIARFIAESFTAAGVSVELRVLPWEEYTAALAAGDFDLYYGEVRLTADWDLTALLGSRGAMNYGGWANAYTDQLIAALAAAGDRAAAMESLCVHLKTQAPLIPVCFKSLSVLTQAEVVEHLSPTAAEPFYDLSGCVVHLKET